MCLLRVVNRSSSGGGVGGCDGAGLAFGAIGLQLNRTAQVNAGNDCGRRVGSLGAGDGAPET